MSGPLRWMFWVSAFWVVYAYAGYPFLLLVVARIRRRRAVREPIQPQITAIVAVHNGASRIRAKLRNLLEQEYPGDRLEILVADDASDDGTEAIVKEEFASRGVRWIGLPERGGKERAQKAAVEAATGEILVFSDVGTRLDRDGLASIVRSFADPSVGCVSSTDRFLDRDGSPVGEGWYVRYEMALRRLESDVHSVVGASGSFFAARRGVCADFSPRLQSDFRTVLCAIRLGYRSVIDSGTFGYYSDLGKGGAEFERKVRTVVRGLTVLFEEGGLLNPFRYGLFSWQFFSHKVARWTVPAALLLLLVTSAALAASSPLYLAALGAQALGYVYAAVASVFPSLQRFAPGKILHYFVQVNVSIVVAWFRFARGERIVAWEPSRR